MKKLSTLLFALLFTAGMAFGQNNAITSQSGSQNEVTVNQTYQNGGSGDANGAVVAQDGNNNQVLRLHQVGAGNGFGVTQNGDDNTVSIHPDQGDANGGGPSFDGNIQIHQWGTSNKVWDADQAGHGNEMYINQGSVGADGTNNIVNVEAQVNNTENSDPNVINIDQSGSNNVVGGYGENDPGAYQEGEANSMDIDQSGGALAGTQDYLPTSGPNGYSEVQFRGSVEGGQGLIQLGTNNQMTLSQNGDSSIPVIYQNGSDNMANVTQNGAGNVAGATQVGTGNHTTITQN